MKPGTAIGMCFDLDGVLWDTSEIHAAAYDAVCLAEGLETLPYDRLAGLTTRDGWVRLLEANGMIPDEETLGRLTMAKQSLARGALCQDAPLNENLDVLRTVDSLGCRTALVTGSSRETTDIFLRASKSVHSFDVVVTAESCGRGKPASDPYELAARGLGLDPARCWTLEDSSSGIESACSAGTRVVHYSSLLPCEETHARTEACVSGLSQFITLVERGLTRPHPR